MIYKNDVDEASTTTTLTNTAEKMIWIHASMADFNDWSRGRVDLQINIQFENDLDTGGHGLL